MSDPFPSLNALRAFEAAGRHMSFSKAAEELHVSPSAIGHQISGLERFLGTRLFRRMNRVIELTQDGEALFPGLSDGFGQLRAVVEGFQTRHLTRPLVVTVEPVFGAKWLMFRLERFRERYQEIGVRIDPTRLSVDLQQGDVDVALRYGIGDFPNLHVEHVFSGEEIVAVCSPDLLKGPHAIKQPEDLRWHTLVHRSATQHLGWNAAQYVQRTDWKRWFQAAGFDQIHQKDGLEVTFEDYAILAAIQGQAVALASSLLVADDLAAGLLVKPFDVSLSTNFGYYFVCTKQKAADPNVVAFRDWISEEAKMTFAGVAPFVQNGQSTMISANEQ